MISLPGYAISEKLHQGTRTTIFRGLRISDRKPVILKYLNPESLSSLEISRFENEYDISCRFNNERITRCLGMERLKESPFMVFEDIGGISLNRIDGLEKTDTAWILKLASNIARGIGVIHAQGIIHKNINPSNIVFNPHNDNINIIDFDLSTELTREIPALKDPDNFNAILPYISPEQTRRTNRTIDYRTDMYSFGITLYQMLTGKLPFSGNDTLEIVHAHIAGTPVSPGKIRPGLSWAIALIIEKLMAKNPEDRYQSIQGLVSDLSVCIMEMEKKGEIEVFPLGRKDFSEKLHFPQKHHGRKDEMDIFFKAYERVRQGGSEMLLLSGCSGIGKSFLVSEFNRLLPKDKCCFISGKNDQYKRNLPYAAIIDAFSEFISRMLTESRDNIAAWRKRILDAIGLNGQVIIDCIPDLALITGNQPHVQKLSLAEAGNRFKSVLIAFIQAFATQEQPLVIFLDDLQWTDTATLSLMRTILSDPKIPQLLVIGAFKENSIEDTHHLAGTLDEIIRSEIHVNRIFLEPLSSEATNRIIADTLGTDPDETIVLSERIRTKTGGNPFFIKEFLKTLHREGAVFFNKTTCRWQWEIEAIRKMATTDNVVDLMIQKIHYLPSRVMQMLMLAACIGSRFDFRTLSLISHADFSETVNLLWQAVEEELVAPVDDNYKYLFCLNDCQMPPVWFRFMHDKVQEAAYKMFSSKEKQQAHLQIGLLMLAHTPKNRLDDKLFDIVNHFNIAKSKICDPDEKIMLVRLNLKAGKKAMRSAANETALACFSSALELLPENSWCQHYELTHAIYMGCAQCEYLCGMISLSESRFRFLLEKVTSAHEKIKIYHVIIRILQNQGKYEQAVRTGISALNLLNTGIPLAPGKKRFFLKSLKIRMLLGGKRPQDLKRLPLMKNRQILAVMNTLEEIMAPAMLYKSECGMYVGLKMMEFILEYGNTDQSPFVYSVFGAILSGRNENYKSAHAYGRLAIELAKQSGDKNLICKTCFLFATSINHWVAHANTGLELYQTVYTYGQESDNPVLSAWAAASLLTVHVVTGSQLSKLTEEIEKYRRFVKRIKYDDMTNFFILSGRYVSALEGGTPDMTDFCGDDFDEALFIRDMESGCRHNGFLAYYYTIKCQLYFLSGQYEKALETANRLEDILPELKGLLLLPEYYFFFALSLARIYPAASRHKKSRLLLQIKTVQKRFKIWADNCKDNFFHKYMLITAEILRITGKIENAPRHYNRSIQSAIRNGYIQNEAIANECCAFFYMETGNSDMAHRHMANAHCAYMKWGAVAKARQLEAEFSAEKLQIAAGSQLHDLLDRRSMLKTFRAISREIDLTALIRMIMKSIIENAGAQRGILLLNKDEGLFIEAESRIEWKYVLLTPSIPITQYQTLPAAVINYTAHKSRPIIIADARFDEMFSKEPYFADQKKKSILCSPILYQGKLKGIIYLENNAAPSIFTEDRAFAIDMLSAQAAISLENALLYARLKESENKYRSIFENAVEGIFQVTRKGTFISVNESLAAILGYNGPNELIDSGINVGDLFFYDSKRKSLFLRQLGKTEQIRGFQVSGKRKDGSIFWVSVSARAVFDPKGKIIYYEGSAVDISERIQKQKAERQRKIAESADRAKSIFLANMSHEIRTPLNAILGLTELSIINGVTGKQRSFVRKINDCASTLLKTIDDILHFSKLEAGQVALETIDFTIPDIVETIDSLFTHETSDKNIFLDFSISKQIPPILRGDPFRLRQVLTNLAANAFKFTESGRITIGVKCMDRKNGIARMAFFVSDTGIGICETDISRLFKAFSQADNSISRIYGGTGLGLAISKGIVDLMNGRIWAKNNPEKGATFFFEVDIAYRDNPALPTDDNKEMHPVRLVSGTKVLLVDDNAINREITPGLLENEGYIVDVAADGKEAIEKTKQYHYDAVLMDVQMPGMDGFEAARAIRQNPANKDLVIIAMTAHVMEGYRKQCMDAGMTDYIPKLINMNSLGGILSKTIGREPDQHLS